MGRRDMFLLSIFTLVTAVAWIAFDVYHAYVDTTIPKTVEKQLVPITPTFDRGVVEKLKERSIVLPLESDVFQATVSSGQTFTLVQPSSATQSGLRSGPEGLRSGPEGL